MIIYIKIYNTVVYYEVDYGVYDILFVVFNAVMIALNKI